MPHRNNARVNGQELIASLRSGKRIYGTGVVSNSPRWPPTLQGLGLDFVFIDTEHLSFDRSQVGWMCRSYAAMGLVPIVRIPAPDPYQATMALDDGAVGIVAPYVETVEQVRALRGAVKHRPLKGRRLEERIDGQSVSRELDDYIREKNAGNVLLINIESQPAIDGLDQLIESGEVDGVLIGPHDLSCNLGVPENYRHPAFLDAVRTIFKQARARNIGAGIHFWGSVEEHVQFIEWGANMLIQSADFLLFRKVLLDELTAIKQAVGDHSGEAPAPVAVI